MINFEKYENYDPSRMGHVSYINKGVMVIPFWSAELCSEVSDLVEQRWNSEEGFDRLPCWGGGSEQPRGLKHSNGSSLVCNDLWVDSTDAGLEKFFYDSCKRILEPEMQKYYDLFFKSGFYGTNKNGDKWCKPWIMRYAKGYNSDLEAHLDLSTFTVSVALNDEYVGGGLYFPTQEGLIINNVPKGYAVVFPGMITHTHGVFPIVTGHRLALISMMYGQNLEPDRMDNFSNHHYQPYNSIKGSKFK